MYRPTLNNRDRTGVIVGVVAIHAGLAFALLHMSGTVDLIPEQADLQVFDVNQPEPPPPVVIEEIKEKAPEKEGEASPRNIKSEATPVVRPKPRVEVPAPPVIVASPTPNQGAAPTQGAAPVPGPGTGAGGVGSGLGAGGSGSGRGGGGGVAVRPQRIAGDISRRDYPRGIRGTAPVERVFVAFYVDTDGYVRECSVTRSSGNPPLDSHTCELIKQRFRYRPARDRSGQPVRFQNLFVQEWFDR